jgi:hypothetical protein
VLNRVAFVDQFRNVLGHLLVDALNVAHSENQPLASRATSYRAKQLSFVNFSFHLHGFPFLNAPQKKQTTRHKILMAVGALQLTFGASSLLTIGHRNTAKL